jgi:putative ABC transport system permease protein
VRALRQLAARPAFALTAIFTLALGIGASTAIYSVAYAVLLRPLPYPDADRLVRLRQVGDQGRQMAFSAPNVEDLSSAARTLAAVATHTGAPVAVTGGVEPVRVRQAMVSRTFFEVLGVGPARGRAFVADELQPAGPGAVIVSHGFWQRELGGTADVLDRTLRLGSDAYRIVGVMPPQFDFPRGAALWTPAERQERLPSRTAHNWDVVARLRGDVPLPQARAELSGIARRMKTQHGEDTWMSDAAAIPLRDAYVGTARPLMALLAGAVGLLLLVSCATVANLLLAQGVLREHEFAVRQAVGAGPMRLVRQLFGEHAALVGLGAAAGLLLALSATRAVLALVPAGVPLPESVTLDGNLIMFVLGLATTLALLLALTTGVRIVTQVPREALSGGRGGIGGRATERVRQSLVVLQLAFALVLLVTAGALGQRLWTLLRADPGFATSGTTVATLTFSAASSHDYQRIAAQVRDVRARLTGLGAVRAAGAVSGFPLGDGAFSNGTFLEMRPGDRLERMEDFQALARVPGRAGEADFRVATPGYFEAMGIPVRQGRLFSDSDAPDGQHVAVVSASLARRQWPGQDPIGRVIQFGNMDGDLRPMTIVGVVGDVREGAVDGPPSATFYGHAGQRTQASTMLTFAVRPSAPGTDVAADVRQVVRAAAPDSPVQIRDIREVVASSFGEQRFSLAVVLAFGVASLLLAVFGVYGVSSYAVSNRRREFGVRMVLGARPGQILGMVLREGALLVGVGVVAGTGLALVVGRLTHGAVAGLDRMRADVLLVSMVVLAISALVACAGPARRASRVQPAEAIRQ